MFPVSVSMFATALVSMSAFTMSMPSIMLPSFAAFTLFVFPTAVVLTVMTLMRLLLLLSAFVSAVRATFLF
jgi:hypothetical protein